MKNRELNQKKSFSDLRLHAEKTFADHQERARANPPTDTERLLHELQIHQIELELQNEELCQAQEALELTRARYFDLYDLAPVGYITLNNQGIIQEANLTAARLLGVYKSALIHQPLSNFIFPEDQDIYYRQRKLLRDTNCPQCSEVRLIRSPAEIWWGRLEAAPGQNLRNTDPEIRMVLSDITTQKRSEIALYRYAREQATLHAVATAATHSLEPLLLLETILDSLLPTLQATAGWIILQEEAPSLNYKIAAWRGFSPSCRLSDCEFVMSETTFYLENSDKTDTNQRAQPIVECHSLPKSLIHTAELCQFITIPILTRGSIELGQLNLGWQDQNIDLEFNQKWLIALGQQIGIALQKAKLYQQARQVNQLETLYQISRAANASLNLNATLQKSLELTCKALNATEGIIVLLESFTDHFIFTKTPQEIKDPLQICRHSIDNLTFQYNQTAWIKDLSPQAPEYPVWNALFGFPVRSLIGAPLMDNHKKIGVLEVFSATPDNFTQEHVDMLSAITAIITGSLKNAQLYTELQDALKKYEQTQTRLIWAEKMGALGRLSASIAHEINNPLQAMQGYQEMVEAELRNPHSPARLLQYVKIIHTEMERIAHIIRKMEDFYRPSPEEKSLTDLRKTMESMLELCSLKLKKSLIDIVETWDTTVIPIWANTDQIKQLFLNLLLDSIDAMPEGGEIRIHAELDLPLPQAPDTPSIRLEFQDNGLGMSAETLTHLFEPFFTTKPHNSGLGLSICYTIVTQHRGEIKASSQEGKGTTFTIWLPVGASPDLEHS